MIIGWKISNLLLPDNIYTTDVKRNKTPENVNETSWLRSCTGDHCVHKCANIGKQPDWKYNNNVNLYGIVIYLLLFHKKIMSHSRTNLIVTWHIYKLYVINLMVKERQPLHAVDGKRAKRDNSRIRKILQLIKQQNKFMVYLESNNYLVFFRKNASVHCVLI